MLSEEKVRQKLKELRINRGISEEAAAISLGRSGNSSVSRIESGQTRLNFEIVNKLCTLYGVNPLDIFNESNQANKSVVLPQVRRGYLDRLMFRADSELSEEVVKNVKNLQPVLRKLGSIQVKIQKTPINIYDIDQDYSENIFLNNDTAIRYAVSFAQKLRNYLGIGPTSIIDIQDLVWKNLNIPICGIEVGDNIWGMYSRDRFDNPLIIYSANSKFQQRNVFTIAHELGHHFFYKENLELDIGKNIFSNNNIYEKVANKFAQELLVPSQLLREKFDEFGYSLVDELKPIHLVNLANYFRVSYLMINYCLWDAHKISKEKFENLKEYVTNLDESLIELGYEGANFFRPSSSLSAKLEEIVLISLRTKKISKLDACSILDFTTEELMKKI